MNLKKAEKSYIAYRSECEKIAAEAQKYIDWDNDIGCEYMPSDGLCILATIPSNECIGGMHECVCPAGIFFAYVESEGKISSKTFKLMCI